MSFKAWDYLGESEGAIEGSAIAIKTPDGTFLINTSPNGETYISTTRARRLIIIPQAGNNVVIKTES